MRCAPTRGNMLCWSIFKGVDLLKALLNRKGDITKCLRVVGEKV